jgi:hypothetical protein
MELTSLKKGNYTVQVTDMQGRAILSQVVNHQGGSAAQMLKLPNALSAGRYNVRLIGEQNQNFLQVVVKD